MPCIFSQRNRVKGRGGILEVEDGKWEISKFKTWMRKIFISEENLGTVHATHTELSANIKFY